MPDLNFKAYQREIERLRGELHAAETKAGVRKASEALNEAHGDNDIRRLYFSVRNKDHRKDLIEQYRTLMRHADDYTPSRIRDAETDLRTLELKGFEMPWIAPAAVAGFAVWIGWSLAALPGALAGSLAGFFTGNAHIATKRNARARALAEAREELAELVKQRERESRHFGNPYLFSDHEEDSGGEDEGAQPEPDIHWYARVGWADLVEKEIAKGTSTELENSESRGSTPLHRACANGNADVVKILLGAGANVSATNRLHSFTPLHFAASAGSAEVVKMLLDAGGRIDAKDKYGSLPLHRAAASGDPETIRLLVEAGSPIESEAGHHRERPLHEAARGGHAAAVEALLAMDADPSAANAHGKTPLDYAASGGPSFDRIRTLLASKKSDHTGLEPLTQY